MAETKEDWDKMAEEPRKNEPTTVKSPPRETVSSEARAKNISHEEVIRATNAKKIDTIREKLGLKNPEILIDEEREAAYKKLWTTLSKIEIEQGSHKTKELLINLVNSGLSDTGRGSLNIELLDELDLKIAKSESASTIAGREINRPVFIFRTNEAFKNFYIALTGSTDFDVHGEITTRGFVTDLDIEVESGKKARIKLIVAAPGNKYIGHEIRHTIDPHLGRREGYDGILEEVFAYYWETIVEGRYKEGSDKLWDDMRASIWSGKGEDDYYAHYSEKAAKKMTFDEYGQLTGRIVETVKKIQRKYGDHIKTQRAIAQSKTLDELFALNV
ncbi:MAG: hypothetical protein WC070_01080 [Candidatus Magasanikbacteria bacterium]